MIKSEVFGSRACVKEGGDWGDLQKARRVGHLFHQNLIVQIKFLSKGALGSAERVGLNVISSFSFHFLGLVILHTSIHPYSAHDTHVSHLTLQHSIHACTYVRNRIPTYLPSFPKPEKRRRKQSNKKC